MQTPAPFDYERATSVDGAIASLQRLGPEARVIAGGHSLLPMMKLRLANPEHLIDINDLTELAYIREEGGEIRIGALTRHVELLKSELLARHFPMLPRRRDRDRRSGRTQPRHDRRLALPGRRGRGSLGRLHRGQGDGGDPRRDRRANDRHGRVPRRPLHDGRRRRGAAHRGAGCRCGRAAAARTRRSSAAPATGRSPPHLPPSGSTAARISDAGIALSAVGLTTIHLSRAEELLRGRPPSEELFAQAGEIAVDGLLPDCRRPWPDRLQAPSRRRRSPPARSGAQACAPRIRRPEHARLDQHQRRRRSPARSSRACCSFTSSATRPA